MSTTDFDRHFAPLLASFAPPQSEVHQIAHPLHVVSMEEQRIAADLARNRMKKSGELLRREVDRAHLQELNEGAHE